MTSADASSDDAAGDMPSDTSAPSAPDGWLELPRLALRLLATYWPPLVFWFFAQKLAGMALLDTAVQLGFVNHLLGFAGLAVLVVVQLLCTIAMFDALRPGLRAVSSASVAVADAQASGYARARPRFASMLAAALLPFFAYYAAWGLMGDSVRAYILEFLRGSFADRNGLPTDLLNAKGLWVSVALTWALRRAFLWQHKRRPAALWSILATACQAYWVFLGLYVIKHWKDAAWAWSEQRVFWTWFGAGALSPVPASTAASSVPALLAGAGATAARVAQALVLPLAWFAISAVVYGRDLRDPRALLRTDARLELARRRYAALALPLRHAAEKIADVASAGWHAKGVPVVNALQLMLRAGARPTAMLCVCYVAIAIVCDLAWRAVALLIGPHAVQQWEVFGAPLTILFGGPLDLESSLLGEPARICLLAAAVELAVRRARRGTRAPALSDARTAGSSAAASAG